MALIVYITSISGNNAVRKKQQAILDALDVRNIKYSVIDVSSPENENERMFMREKARPSVDHDYALPPQVFCDGEYVGDYEHFAEALEDNSVEVFFKQAAPVRKSPTPVEPEGPAPDEEQEETDSKDKEECSDESEVINEVYADAESDEAPDSNAEDVLSSTETTSAEKSESGQSMPLSDSDRAEQKTAELAGEDEEQAANSVEEEEVQPSLSETAVDSGEIGSDDKVSLVTSEELTQGTDESLSTVEQAAVHDKVIGDEPSDESMSKDESKLAEVAAEETVEGELSEDVEDAPIVTQEVVEEEKKAPKDPDADVDNEAASDGLVAEKDASPDENNLSENTN